MVISVLERRSEIGLRPALGATRRHVSTQFLTEALLLAAIGGTAGASLAAVTHGGAPHRMTAGAWCSSPAPAAAESDS
jgi:putative ABC transport system permease protein